MLAQVLLLELCGTLILVLKWAYKLDSVRNGPGTRQSPSAPGWATLTEDMRNMWPVEKQGPNFASRLHSAVTLVGNRAERSSPPRRFLLSVTGKGGAQWRRSVSHLLCLSLVALPRSAWARHPSTNCGVSQSCASSPTFEGVVLSCN